jgi:ribosomal protein L11 methyltransferase
LADYPALDLQFHSAPGPDAFLRERLYSLLDDFEPTAIHEDERGDTWRVFFGTVERRDAAATHLAAAVAPHLLETTPVDVPDEDWARRSQQKLRAVAVDGLVIAPPWDVPRASAPGGVQADAPVIVIEPSMGFGTGHHATTRLCLRLMQQILLRGARVVDIGTGSGVLALAAWKLGAREVVAVDNDQDALANAEDNVSRNGAAGRIDLVCADLHGLTLASADLVIANLTAAVLVREAPRIESLVHRHGHLILSGFARAHRIEIDPAFHASRYVKDATEEDWHAVLWQKP